MEIKQIKSQLSIETVLTRYNIKVNKNNHAKCPFHKDNKPSLRIYPNTNTYTCFGCGKTGDTIQFIQDIEQTTKHKAILKAKELLGALPTTKQKNKPIMKETPALSFAEMFPKFKQSLHRSKKAIAYLKERGIYDVKLEKKNGCGSIQEMEHLLYKDILFINKMD